MIHQCLKRKEEVLFFLVFNGSKNYSNGILKEVFRLPGGNVIPVQ